MYFNNNHAQGEELLKNSNQILTSTNSRPLILNPKLTSQPTQSTTPTNLLTQSIVEPLIPNQEESINQDNP